MGFFTNHTINYLNLQSALLGLLEQVFGLFLPLYLYTQGFSLPEVFCLLAVFNVARLPLRLLSFPIVHRVGLKPALMIGTAGFCLSFPILGMVKGYDVWLLAYILIFGMFNALYWHCYHTFYSLAGEHEHRGKHLSIALGLGTAVSALAPLLGAIFIAQASFQKFFLLPVPLMFAMLFVLSRCKNIPVHRSSWKDGKKLIFNLGARIHLAEATVVFPMNIGWLFVLYFYAQNRMEVFGGIVTFGMVIQILYQLWLGRIIDGGAGREIAHVAGAMRLLQALGKSFLPLSLPRVLALEALTGATNVHHGLALTTTLYNTGKSSSDAFGYWLFAETAFDLGTILGAGTVALLLWWGVPLRLTILVAVPGITAVWWLTHRYFHDLKRSSENR